jgi:hypothetical protein
MMISAEDFVALRRSRNQANYLRAATDRAPTHIWLDVIAQLPDMRIWVAHNKTVPAEILSILARDTNTIVRAAVAMKNKLPEDLIALLANDVDDSVRERIAYYKKTPIDILRRLSNDPCETVSAQSRNA